MCFYFLTYSPYSGTSSCELPPLPKSLIGFNKLLCSDSGLLSDVEGNINNNNSNNSNTCSEINQKPNDNLDSNENASDKSTPASPNGNKAVPALETEAKSTCLPTKGSPQVVEAGSTLDAQIATLRKEMVSLNPIVLHFKLPFKNDFKCDFLEGWKFINIKSRERKSVK